MGPVDAYCHRDSQRERYYNPCLMAKFIEDDGLRLWIATNGEWCRFPKLYSLKTMPVSVWTNTSRKQTTNKWP